MALTCFAQTTVRPTIEVSDKLVKEYWQQQAIMERANFLQQVTMIGMNDYCTKNLATLKKTRDESDQIVFVCVPNQENDK